MIPEKKILLCLAHMSGNEQQYIQEAFDTNWVVPLGPNVNAFEEILRDFHEDSSKSVVALSSGTAALHLAMVDLGIGPGDEVICQSFTFGASCNPAVYLGAKVVFVDSERETWNMDPQLLEEAIKDRMAQTGKKPKAIIPVYLYGMPPKMDEICEIASRYEIPIIEDAAEGFGSRFNGKISGTFGRYGIMSFNGNKMITTSGGGALLCPNEEARQHVMKLATQARDSFPYYQHTEIGYNYRMSNICAGIGRGQMSIVNEHIAHHKHIQELYRELFSKVDGIELHENPNDKYDSNFWLCTILIDPKIKTLSDVKSPVSEGGQPNDNVEQLRQLLDAKNIESRALWKPMHCMPVHKDAPKYQNGVSYELFQRGLCLPSGPCVTDEEVTYIVESIKESIR